jgi:hypothetical protein
MCDAVVPTFMVDLLCKVVLAFSAGWDSCQSKV